MKYDHGFVDRLDTKIVNLTPVCHAVDLAYRQQRDAIPDSDLDDEQPIYLSVTLTLGDVRKMRRFL